MSISEFFVHRARHTLARDGVVPGGFLPTDISESWQRCVASGLDPRRAPSNDVESGTMLRDLRELHGCTRRRAVAEMTALHKRIADTNFILAFAAPTGMVLDVVVGGFEGSPYAGAIRPGTLWSETQSGTNALGVAAVLRRQVTVQGGEHFFTAFGGLTCIAAPVFAPDGSLAGILDASCDFGARQHHTQALVAMSATQIENSLIREYHRDDILIAFHHSEESLRTLEEGLVAVRLDGKLLAANRQARILLRGAITVGDTAIETIFRQRLDDILSEGRRRERQVLDGRLGARVIATIENIRSFDLARRQSVKPRVQPEFVANDTAVRKIVGQVEAAALRRIPILIRGETGTGKEQLARHAHKTSGRKGAFVPVNCAGLPAGLIEAELFGYADGAFTGARRGGAIGLIKEADGGTLFLDEIGDMPVTLQAILLRFLDDWTAQPIGGTGSKVDVLLVSATNAGLDCAIAENRFRADLLYRLNTLEVTLPPLAARNDFDRIARHLLAAIEPQCEISSGAIARLAEQAWPGNMRQLRNTLTRLSLGTDGFINEAAVEDATGTSSTAPAGGAASIGGTLRDAQRARILAAHAGTGGNISETARSLNISRNTVYRALQQTGRRA